MITDVDDENIDLYDNLYLENPEQKDKNSSSSKKITSTHKTESEKHSTKNHRKYGMNNNRRKTQMIHTSDIFQAIENDTNESCSQNLTEKDQFRYESISSDISNDDKQDRTQNGYKVSKLSNGYHLDKHDDSKANGNMIDQNGRHFAHSQDGRLNGCQDGRQKGRQDGRQDCRQDGHQDGRQDGRQNGRQDGRQNGRQDGRQNGCHVPCTNEEDGDSVDSTAFDFDSVVGRESDECQGDREWEGGDEVYGKIQWK